MYSCLMMLQCFSSLVLLLPLLIGSDRVGYASRVLELSDRFIEIKKEGMWLVKFYAPWCGHCKSLEPIYNHVAQALHDTPIRVGRVDCTRFPTVGTEFQVQGFPTIMFLKGGRKHVYSGERSTEDIVSYAKRMSGSAVRNLGSDEGFEELCEKYSTMFGFIGDKEGEVWDAFNSVAEDNQAHLNFYTFQPNKIPVHFSNLKGGELPKIFVYKDKRAYLFDKSVEVEDGGNLTNALGQWISKERFPRFVKVSRSNFQLLLTTKKFIVMVVVEEDKLGRITDDMTKFRDMLEAIVERKVDRYRNFFQFGWVGSPELANSVAMATLTIPSLLVVNSTSYHHHIPDDEPHHLTPEAIETFLEQLINQTATVYGGNTWTVRFYRTYYESKISLVNMWNGNPVLTALLFGLPLGFMSLIFYSICCADIMDASEEDDDIIHEKKE